MKKIYLIYFCCLSFFANAQFENTLPSMRGLYQSSYINPAFTPEYKTSIGLPGINNLGARVTMYGVDLHTISSSMVMNQTDSFVDLNVLYSKLDGPIGFNAPITNDILYVRFPIKGYYVGLSNTMKINASYLIAKEFIGFLAQGNDYFKGQNNNYELMRVNVNAYNETGISLSKEYKRLSLGIRFKYLIGVGNVTSDNIRFSIATSNTIPYPVSITAGGNIKTAGIPLVNTADTVDGHPIVTSDTAALTLNDVISNRNNTGYGFDLGFCYQVSSKVSFWGSVTDLGSFINWNTKVYKYSLDGTKVDFGGMNYDQANNPEKRTNLIDSLKAGLGNATISRSSYKTTIPTKINAGIDFDLGTKNRVGYMFQGQSFYGDYQHVNTFNYMHRFGKNWQLTSNYSLTNFKYSDVGVGTSTKMGPLQFYFLTDNLTALFHPNTARKIYLRLGINLVFGRIEKQLKVY